MKTMLLLTLIALVAVAGSAEAEPTCQNTDIGGACADAGPENGEVRGDFEAAAASVHLEASYSIG